MWVRALGALHIIFYACKSIHENGHWSVVSSNISADRIACQAISDERECKGRNCHLHNLFWFIRDIEQ